MCSRPVPGPERSLARRCAPRSPGPVSPSPPWWVLSAATGTIGRPPSLRGLRGRPRPALPGRHGQAGNLPRGLGCGSWHAARLTYLGGSIPEGLPPHALRALRKLGAATVLAWRHSCGHGVDGVGALAGDDEPVLRLLRGAAPRGEWDHAGTASVATGNSRTRRSSGHIDQSPPLGPAPSSRPSVLPSCLTNTGTSRA